MSIRSTRETAGAVGEIRESYVFHPYWQSLPQRTILVNESQAAAVPNTETCGACDTSRGEVYAKSRPNSCGGTERTTRCTQYRTPSHPQRPLPTIPRCHAGMIPASARRPGIVTRPLYFPACALSSALTHARSAGGSRTSLQPVGCAQRSVDAPSAVPGDHSGVSDSNIWWHVAAGHGGPSIFPPDPCPAPSGSTTASQAFRSLPSPNRARTARVPR